MLPGQGKQAKTKRCQLVGIFALNSVQTDRNSGKKVALLKSDFQNFIEEDA
jgi:hypothetical protein